MERAAAYPNAAVTTLYERYGPVFSFGFGPLRFIWLIGADANRFVLQDAAEHFTLRRAYHFLQPITGDYALITSDEPAHLRRRRLVQPAFHQKRLTGLVQVIDRRLGDLFASLPLGRPFDLYSAVRPSILRIICETLLGRETLQRTPELVTHVGAMMHFANRPFLAQQLKLPLPGTPWQRFLRSRRSADKLLFAEIARRRRGEPTTDVIGMLLEAKDDAGEGLSDREVRDQAVSLVSAGFDTTSAALSWAVYALLAHPDVLGRLREEVDSLEALTLTSLALPYLDRVVKETLRLYPPAPAGLRQADRDLEYAGYRLKKGSLVAFSSHLTHRLTPYRNPLQFNPERWNSESEEVDKPPPFAYLPFGGGSRYCIGASLARMIIKVSLIRLLQRYDIQAAWTSPVEETGNTVHPKNGLWTRLRPL